MNDLGYQVRWVDTEKYNLYSPTEENNIPILLKALQRKPYKEV